MAVSIEDLESSSDAYQTYNVTFFNDKINTIVTHTPSVVGDWIAKILRNHQSKLIVGLDIEWRPNFIRNIENPVAILQLCVDRSCLIFQLIYANRIPRCLIDFLNNPNFAFVGVKIDEDVKKLLVDYDLQVANTVDISHLAAKKLDMKFRNAGLKTLAMVVLGKEIEKPKSVTLSPWDDSWLSYDQIQYACVDAFLSFEIGRSLITLKKKETATSNTHRTFETATSNTHRTLETATSNTHRTFETANSSTHRTYQVTFSDDRITTTLTHVAYIVDDWIDGIRRFHRHRLHKLIVGLDIKWRPSYNRDITNPVAILQLCVGRRCLIFQLICAEEIPQSLVDFLSDPNFTFVAVGIYEDVEKLSADHELEVSNAVDLRDLAATELEKKSLMKAGLKTLAIEVLGKEVEKPAKSVLMSSWDDVILTDAQVQYACVEAFLSFEIGRTLTSTI